MGCRVAVVGGGAIGLSCALQLVSRGIVRAQEVVVADAPTRPGAASRAAAGMVVPLAEFHQDSPLFRFAMESAARWPGFLEEFAPEKDGGPILMNCGALVPAGDDEEGRAARLARFAAAHGEVQCLTSGDLSRLEPTLTGARWKAALLLPGAIVNPRHLHDSLRARCLQMGVRLHEGTVTRIGRKDGRATTLGFEDGLEIAFDQLVIASGSWSATLGDLLGVTVPIGPIKGQVARVAAEDGLLRHIVHTEGVYFAPRPGEGIIIGASVENVGFDDSVHEDVVSGLIEAAMEHAPRIASLPLVEAWAGFRPRFADSLPAIGRCRSLGNVLIATGHYRNGILMTPLTGEVISNHLADENCTDWPELSPARLGI